MTYNHPDIRCLKCEKQLAECDCPPSTLHPKANKAGWRERFEKLRITGIIVHDLDDRTYIHEESTKYVVDFIEQVLSEERERIVKIAEGMIKTVEDFDKRKEEMYVGIVQYGAERGYNKALSDLIAKINDADRI